MFDVAVVGAGPGGSWAAYQLARLGARVALVDGSHPREKPCGGGVTRRALGLISSALPDLANAGIRVGSARFVDTPRARECAVPLGCGSEPGLVVLSRLDLDGRLLDLAGRAGSELLPTRVTNLVRIGERYRLDLSKGRPIVARVLVGADGVTSVVRRRLASPFRRAQLSIATGFFAYGPVDREIVIEFMADPPGYFWSFPRPDHLSVGVCAQADAAATSGHLRARTADWMRATGIGAGSRWQPYAWPIPSLSASELATLAIAGNDWCVIGDAAGLVDPITREGIYFSLRSAELAAAAIAAGDLSQYVSRVRTEIIAELARAARLKEGFFKPHFTGLVLDALVESPSVRRVMADLVTGEQTYQGLAWRLLTTCEVGFAWRLAKLKARRSRPAPARVHQVG